MRFVIEGPPRTKKNHGRVIQRGKRRFHVPSEAQATWAAAAKLQLQKQFAAPGFRDWCGGHAIRTPLNLRATIYRDALRGDAVGYYQAIADALEAAGVVENDRLIVAWDGSRMLVDRDRPRVELELTPMDVEWAP